MKARLFFVEPQAPPLSTRSLLGDECQKERSYLQTNSAIALTQEKKEETGETKSHNQRNQL